MNKRVYLLAIISFIVGMSSSLLILLCIIIASGIVSHKYIGRALGIIFMDICKNDKLKAKEVIDGHFVSCYLY